MRVEQFSEFKTGRLLPISPDGRFHDYAFLPNPLPPNWKPSPATWRLVAEARDRVGKLDGAGDVLPNPSLLLRPLQRREAIKSNSIEGTYVTPEELLRFEADKSQSIESSPERRGDWIEVFRYEAALKEGCERIARGEKLDRALFCILHRQLLETQRGHDKSPGMLRDRQVYVEVGRRYIPPPPEYLEELLVNLEDYLAEETSRDPLDEKASDPLVRAFIAHYQFEAIHPFKDGNGRIGRLLLSLCIYKWLGHSHAWLYMSGFFDQNRSEYIRRLFAVSAHGEWDEWIRFCLLGAIEQAEAAIATCRKLDELKRRYEQETAGLSVRMNAILSRLLSNPFVEPSALARELQISYNTARNDLRKLVEKGILEELPGQKQKTYFAHEIFAVAYGG